MFWCVLLMLSPWARRGLTWAFGVFTLLDLGPGGVDLGPPGFDLKPRGFD